MNEKAHEPAYRAAFDSAQTELGQIYERLSQLRVRQEQIQVAADALKLLVGTDSSVESPTHTSKAVFEINTKDFMPSTPAVSQDTEEESGDSLQDQIKKALRVPSHA
jgi:hypothetical protein